MAKKITFIIIALVLMLPGIKAEEQKREMRAAWLATVSNIDWPSERGTGAAVILSRWLCKHKYERSVHSGSLDVRRHVPVEL